MPFARRITRKRPASPSTSKGETMTPRWLLTLGLAVLMFLGAAPSAPAQEKKGKEQEKAKERASSGRQTVAVFRLHGELAESPTEEPFPLAGPQAVSLKDLVERLRKAADDSSVKAVALFV